jgi:ethanolamine utilization protein EutA
MDAILKDCGVSLSVNDRVELRVLEKICSRMAEVVLESVSTRNLSGLAKQLTMTEPLSLDYSIDVVMISGGVADYVYSEQNAGLKETVVYGDVGPLLGQMINRYFSSNGLKLIKPAETIRATVIGAGVQTLDVSGSTISVTDDRLPMKNIPVMIPFTDSIPADEEKVAAVIERTIDNIYRKDDLENLAIAFQGNQYFSFTDIQEIAKGIARGSEKLIRARLPLIIVLEQDCGKVLGQTLQYLRQDADIICIDQIKVDEGDYIDIGKSIAGGTVVPVVIKTLVFETKQI